MSNSPDPIYLLALMLLKWSGAAEQPVESVDGERVDVGASGSSSNIISDVSIPVTTYERST